MKRTLVIATLAGLALGVCTRFVYELPREWWWFAKIGGPWLAVAFLVGRATRRPLEGAAAGAFALVVATLVYYGIMGLVQHAYDRSPLGLWWLAVAVPSGAAFGGIGSGMRSLGRPVSGAVVLAAAFAAEAIVTPGRSTPGPAALAIAALLLPIVAVRDWRQQSAAYMGLAVVAVLAAAAARAVYVVTGYA